MSLWLYNTASRKIEVFTPPEERRVSLYTCGPTVYDSPHIGNWVAYIYWDTLVRTLLANGYAVERVMNVTDVGHLVSDADDGEDKLEKGARREGKTAWQIAEFYAEDFMNGMEKLGLMLPSHIARATDYIPQQLDLVRTLKTKGYTYRISDGIYFDTAKFPSYADFAGLNLDELKAGERVEVNPEKRHPSDFALWKFTPQNTKRDMEWETPEDLLSRSPGYLPLPTSRSTGEQSSARGARLALDGDISPVEEDNQARLLPSEAVAAKFSETSATRVSTDAYSTATRSEAVSEDFGGGLTSEREKVMGFPGWHLECSAIAMNFFGPSLDIHTGGIDHIPVHHTNEIAQSEAATGQRFAGYWLHNNHLKAEGTKISKSLGNGYTLQNLEEKGFSPLDFRLFVLQSHYQSEGNFSFDALAAARNRLMHWRGAAALRWQIRSASTANHKALDTFAAAEEAIRDTLGNNLDTPGALRLVDEVFSRLENLPLASIPAAELSSLLKSIDELLGVQLLDSTPDIGDEIRQLISEREKARQNQDWETSDKLRIALAGRGLAIRDTAEGTVWSYAE